MNLIHQHTYFSLFQKDLNSFFIFFPNYNRFTSSIINSIISTNLIPTSFTDENLTYIQFRANSLFTLEQYLQRNDNISYDLSLHILFYLYHQQLTLKKYNCNMVAISNQDILIIDDKHCVCVNPSILSTIYPDNTIKLSYPLDSHYFISPQIYSTSQIPTYLSQTTFLYSLASLIVYSLFRITIPLQDNLKHDEYIKNALLPIYSSKLYSCLIRMLAFNPNKRIFLFL